MQVLLGVRAQEAGGELEPVLATGVSRLRWIASYAANAFAGAIALLLLFAAGTGLAAGAVLGDISGELRALTGASLVQLSGIVVIGAIVIAAAAMIPRCAGVVSWAMLTAAILTGPLFGTTFKLPGWAQDLSPFTHVPKVPAAAQSATPMLALTAIGLIGLAVGWAAFPPPRPRAARLSPDHYTQSTAGPACRAGCGARGAGRRGYSIPAASA